MIEAFLVADEADDEVRPSRFLKEYRDRAISDLNREEKEVDESLKRWRAQRVEDRIDPLPLDKGNPQAVETQSNYWMVSVRVSLVVSMDAIYSQVDERLMYRGDRKRRQPPN